MAYGSDGPVVHQALVGEKVINRGGRGPVPPLGEPASDEQAVNRPGVASLEVTGRVPAGFPMLRSHDEAEQAAEVAGCRGLNARCDAAGAQGALADAGVLAPHLECARVRGTGDVVDYKARPARVRVHARRVAKGCIGWS